jgi:hypothetical protein
MSRSRKLAALVGALAVLSTGPGCGVFDGFCDCDDGYTTEYQSDGIPTPRDLPPAQTSNMPTGTTTTPAEPGMYTSGAPKR